MKLTKKIRKIIIYLITSLILAIRPIFGASGMCKYELSCTQYAIKMLNQHTFFKACWLILKRIINCR